MLTIIEYPNKILRTKSSNVNLSVNGDIRRFAQELGETMLAKEGLGLAAPQVGKNINIIAVYINNQPEIFVNPIVVWKNWFKKNITEEGCISFPGIFGFVKRPKTVWIKYNNLSGQTKFAKYQGLLATVFQHEIDHLKGRLFIDKILSFTKGEKKLKELISKAKNGEK